MNFPEFMNKVAIEPALSTYAPSEPLIWYAFYVGFSQAHMLAFFSMSQLSSLFQSLPPQNPHPTAQYSSTELMLSDRYNG